jgi:hypothetical protein
VTARALSLITLTLLGGALLACGGSSCGRNVAKVVPAVGAANPEYTVEPVDCDPPITLPAAQGCSQKTITCGDTVAGNNATGRYHFEDDFYTGKFCSPERHDYENSPEAVFLLNIPGDVQADVTMVSDCEDLDLASVQWNDRTRCPTINHTTGPCEMSTKRGGGTIRITSVDKPESHLIIVDGKKGVTGNFRLSVKCTTYR